MKCGKCNSKLKCVDSRAHRISSVRQICKAREVDTERRYICPKCNTTYYSQEYIVGYKSEKSSKISLLNDYVVQLKEKYKDEPNVQQMRNRRELLKKVKSRSK